MSQTILFSLIKKQYIEKSLFLVERVNDYAYVVDEVVVRNNISLCLRNFVMT